MRILFSIFVLGILSSTAMADLVCKRIGGCELFPDAKTESEYCPTCVVDSAPVLELTKPTNSGNICIEKRDECIAIGTRNGGDWSYMCSNVKIECEAGLK